MKSLTEDLNVNKNITSRILMGSFQKRALEYERTLKCVQESMDVVCEMCKSVEKLVKHIL